MLARFIAARAATMAVIVNRAVERGEVPPGTDRKGGLALCRPAFLILRGTSRDAEVRRVLARVAVEPVTKAIGQRAGQLIGAAAMSARQAVDAMVAATAIKQAEQAEAADRPASVLIVTSDLPDLTRLVAGRPGVAVVHVSRMRRPSGS